jgi:uncharacterized protein
MNQQTNVYGMPLQPCSFSPQTGYVRDGYCTCISSDIGQHTICVIVTESFLEFSASVGNDLSTPRPEFNFPGLLASHQWCLCLSRWIEARDAGCAPHVILESSNISILEHVSLEELESYQL